MSSASEIFDVWRIGWAAAGGAVGAIVGSFLATILLRWPQDRSALTGRSMCDHCDRLLGPAELIPVLSHLRLKGRCRTCNGRIDPTHLQVELAAAAMGAIAFALTPGIEGGVTALFGWWLLLIGALDAEHRWLPDRLTLPLLLAGLAVAWSSVGPPIEDRLIGTVGGYISLSAAAAIYRAVRHREGLGGGDPKLFAALGAWLGWQMLPYLIIGAGLMGIASVAFAALRPRTPERSAELPLGTFLVAVAWPAWILTN